jgi:acetyl esterase/lipase
MRRIFLVVTVLLTLLLGCGAQPVPTLTPVPPTSTPDFVAPTPAHSVEVTRDVEYTTPLQPDVPAQELDVYAPAEAGPWPVVVLLPGYAMKKETLPYKSLAEELAGRGLVVLVPNWRSAMSTEAARDDGLPFRESSEELTCAVRFARARAADYGGDAGRITLVGHASTEAAETTMALAGDNAPAWEAFAASRGGPPAQVGCQESGAPAGVDALVEFGGGYTAVEFLKEQDPELWAVVSPYAHLDRDPDLLVRLVHGEQDQVVSLDKAVQFQEALVEAGYDATLTVVDAEHQLPWFGPGRETLIQIILDAARR